MLHFQLQRPVASFYRVESMDHLQVSDDFSTAVLSQIRRTDTVSRLDSQQSNQAVCASNGQTLPLGIHSTTEDAHSHPEL